MTMLQSVELEIEEALEVLSTEVRPREEWDRAITLEKLRNYLKEQFDKDQNMEYSN